MLGLMEENFEASQNNYLGHPFVSTRFRHLYIQQESESI